MAWQVVVLTSALVGSGCSGPADGLPSDPDAGRRVDDADVTRRPIDPDSGTGNPCETGLTACGAACIDTTNNALDCGSCGNSCSSGLCIDSTCLPEDACTEALGMSCDAVAGSYIKASNADPGDFFGGHSSVAVSGDTLAVGAPAESSAAVGIGGSESSNSALASGAVYVFRRSETGWTQEAYIKASNAEASDRFGAAVGLSGDTLVVGAPGEDGSATAGPSSNSVDASGAAYVFERTGSAWDQAAYLKAQNAGALDSFGASVAIDGPHIAVGAPNEDSSASGTDGSGLDVGFNSSGAVYMFRGNGSGWDQVNYLKAEVPDASDRFGMRLSLSGETLAVGSIGESSGPEGDPDDDSARSAGAAWIFRLQGSSWMQEAFIKASNAEQGDWFGESIDIDGNLLVVGAPGEASAVSGAPENNDVSFAGAVYVFERTGEEWREVALLKAATIDRSDRFGQSVAVSDGRIAVGAPNESSRSSGLGGDESDNSLLASGAGYLFAERGETFTQILYIKAARPGATEGFGVVRLDGGLLAVSSPSEAGGGSGVDTPGPAGETPGSGAVYTYNLTP